MSMWRKNGLPLLLFVVIFGMGSDKRWTGIAAGSAEAFQPSVRESADLSIQYLRCEYKLNPVGIDVIRPRLSWQLVSSRRGAWQSAYQIRVARNAGDLRASRELLWDSGEVESDQSIHVVYGGPELESGERYYWQVRVWDAEDRPSSWSGEAYWEMGLLTTSDWKANWISPDSDQSAAVARPAPMLRREFRVQGNVSSARVYVTCLGLYEMELNGKRVGDQVFAPGWTSYKKRLQYQTYDITEHLEEGANAIGVTLGDGWYRGKLGFQGRGDYYGQNVALLLQIRIGYTDGRDQVVTSDEMWKSSTGPILMSDIYMGEAYDARLEKPGWSRPGFDDGDWTGVRIIEHSKEILLAPAGPPVRTIQEIHPLKIIQTPAGETVFDLGQNMVGWVRLKVQGDAGKVVTLRHAEVLDKEGNFYTRNLRAAAQTVEYTLKGGSVEVYEPHFTFQGFRYVAVEGLPGNPQLADLTGVVIHSDMTQTGSFESSNTLINQLQHNIVWGQKGNFLDVPTDCPQRDERLGWTGDAQVFARTASFNMDVASFFTKWLGDLAADQTKDGRIHFVIPDVLGGAGSAAWADAGAIIPWTIYLVYGDKRILETQYESMKAWVEYMKGEAGEDFIWDTGFHFGDWLAFATTRSDYPGATTDKDLIATSFFAYSTSLLERTARVLGKVEEAESYANLLENIKRAYLAEFVTPRGRLASNTQTAYALALNFDLLPDELRSQAAGRLAADVRRFDNHLTTGFVGTPYLCHVLTRFGYLDVAYDLVNQETYPSWLYPVKQGATTIWERWDGIKPDGSFQDPGMNSFNHYAYGAIGEWLYRVTAGINLDPSEPGYKHVLIQPRPGPGFTSVDAGLDSMYGRIESHWDLTDSKFHLMVVIPVNTRATVRLPDAAIASVTESGKKLSEAEGIVSSRQEGGDAVIEVGSGNYSFDYDLRD